MLVHALERVASQVASQVDAAGGHHHLAGELRLDGLHLELFAMERVAGLLELRRASGHAQFKPPRRTGAANLEKKGALREAQTQKIAIKGFDLGPLS